MARGTMMRKHHTADLLKQFQEQIGKLEQVKALMSKLKVPFQPPSESVAALVRTFLAIRKRAAPSFSATADKKLLEQLCPIVLASVRSNDEKSNILCWTPSKRCYRSGVAYMMALR